MYKLCMNQSLHLYINETNNNNQDYNYVQVINFSTQKLLFIYHTESVNGIATCFSLNGSRTHLASMPDNLTDITSSCKPPTTTIPNKLEFRGLVKNFLKFENVCKQCSHHYHQQ